MIRVIPRRPGLADGLFFQDAGVWLPWVAWLAGARAGRTALICLHSLWVQCRASMVHYS
jgi:hypothetical protein